MAIGTTTPTQTKILEPFTQRLFSGDLNYAQSHIYNYVNDLTTLIGNDLIVTGCNINSSSFTDTDITVEINTGYLIHDRAFVDLTDGSNITLTYSNASAFDTNGKFIVVTRFKNYHTNEFHKLRVGMIYVTNGGEAADFNANTDKLILMAIDFTKDGFGNIDDISISESGSITIDGQSYPIRPTKDDSLIEFTVDGGQLPF